MSTRDLEERKKRIMSNVNKNWNNSFSKDDQSQKREYKSSYQDLYWSYTLGEDNSARVKMRMLPDQNGNIYVEEVMYFWKNPKNGLRYNAKCRDFLGKRDDPMTNYKNGLWKQDEENKKKGIITSYGKDSKINKTTRLVTNVYIIEDENNPENNGKVFLWNMPKTFYEIIMNKSGYESKASSFGEDDDVPDRKINPYDPFSGGANIILEVHKANTNNAEYSKIDYSATRFVRRQGPLFEDEEQIYDVLDKCHDLNEINTESKCQPVEVLQHRLDYVLEKITLDELKAFLANRSNGNSEPPQKKPEVNSFDDDKYESPTQKNIDRFNSEIDKIEEPVMMPKSVKFDVDDDDDFDPDAIKAKLRASKMNLGDDIPF